jgi:hypothetical protein
VGQRWSQAVSGILSFGSSNDVSQLFVRYEMPHGSFKEVEKTSENLAANLKGRSKLVRIAFYFSDCTTPKPQRYCTWKRLCKATI